VTEHELKTWPEPFQAVLDGRKRYEIRKDDRGFAVGDVLHLREFRVDIAKHGIGGHGIGDGGEYTGRSVRVRVTYVTHGRWGLPAGLCVMSITQHPEGGE
jgi:hypothetical protein